MKRYVLALLGAVILATPAAAYDDFYAKRLELGRQAFAAGKPAEAAEELRVACFGMVDAPEALTECVARLTLAQEAAGRKADADATMDRFLKLEKRFGLFAGMTLEPPLKAGFRDLVKKRKGVDLAPPVPTSTPTPTATPTAAPTATATPVPTAAPTAVPTVRPTLPPLIGPPAPPAAAVPAVTVAPAVPAVTPEAARTAAVLAEARKLVDENQAAAAKSLLLPLATPGSGREVRKALLETAVLTRDYRLAVEQGSALAPFGEGEDSAMFYAAIALFETGKKQEAKALAERSLPRLKRTTYVDYYAKRIRTAF